MYNTREEIETWLKEMKVKNYIINEDLTVDVDGNVDMSYKELKEIPIRFGKVNGNFYCNENKLTSLEGCPEIINGNFDCSENNLVNLKGCSKKINGHFYCSHNKLTSLEYCPEEIDGYFYCHDNKLTSLEYCPEIIKNNFSCYNNNLTNLEYFPKEINGNNIYFTKNKIEEYELVNFNCDIKNVSYIYSDFNKDGNKEEFLEKVDFYKSKKENELLKEVSVNSNNIKLNKKL